MSLCEEQRVLSRATAFAGTGLSNWNVQRTTSFAHLFQGAISVNVDMSSWQFNTDSGRVSLWSICMFLGFCLACHSVSARIPPLLTSDIRRQESACSLSPRITACQGMTTAPSTLLSLLLHPTPLWQGAVPDQVLPQVLPGFIPSLGKSCCCNIMLWLKSSMVWLTQQEEPHL